KACFKASAPRPPKARRRGVRQDGLPVPVSSAQRSATRTPEATPGIAAGFLADCDPAEQSSSGGGETDQKGFPLRERDPAGIPLLLSAWLAAYLPSVTLDARENTSNGGLPWRGSQTSHFL